MYRSDRKRQPNKLKVKSALITQNAIQNAAIMNVWTLVQLLNGPRFRVQFSSRKKTKSLSLCLDPVEVVDVAQTFVH